MGVGKGHQNFEPVERQLVLGFVTDDACGMRPQCFVHPVVQWRIPSVHAGEDPHHLPALTEQARRKKRLHGRLLFAVLFADRGFQQA